MTEFIIKEIAIERIKRIKPQFVMSEYGLGYARGLKDVIGLLNAIPVADVQLVIHAHWIELPKAMNPNENPCKCSNCGHILSFMNYYPKSKYCPNCGARMDGDKR